MLKIMTIVGTRPEVIKMSRVIAELDSCSDHILVHTGQNYDYELNEIFFSELNIRRPDYYLNVAEKTPSKTIANVIIGIDELIQKLNPDAILLYGDTNSCLAAISAKKNKVPIFHMEAGNRCFDLRVPEEMNRKMIDHLADINFVLSEHARANLLREGIQPNLIIKTGSHLTEVIDFYRPQIEGSSILSNLSLEKLRYFVVSLHREENVDSIESLSSFVATLNAVAREYELPIIVSTHPRTNERLLRANLKVSGKKIIFSKPFGYFDYLSLQQNAYCVLSDSGTITEESAILGFPAVTLRTTHERPEGMDSGVLVLSQIIPVKVLEAISLIRRQLSDEIRGPLMPVGDYGGRAVSKQIARAVTSYVDYINSYIWHKNA